MRDWVYERDAATVLGRRNEAFSALHVATMEHRLHFDRDQLEQFLECVLRTGPIKERLDSLPLGRDPALVSIQELENAIETLLAREDEVTHAFVRGALERCVTALEAACAEDRFPPELWDGEFDDRERALGAEHISGARRAV